MELTIYFDGGSRGNPGPAGAGAVVCDQTEQVVYEAGWFLGRMTNNMAEYEGLLRALEAVGPARPRRLAIYSDSELVVLQLQGAYRVRNEKLKPLFEAVRSRLEHVSSWTIQHVPRAMNGRADALANAAMDARGDVIVVNALPGAASSEKACGPKRTASRRSAKADAADATTHRAAASDQAAAGARRGDAPSDRDHAMPDAPMPLQRRVRVRCLSVPRRGACPAPCRAGAEFVFERVTPSGVCLDVAGELIEAVRLCAVTGLAQSVTCPEPDCGARFSVKPA